MLQAANTEPLVPKLTILSFKINHFLHNLSQ